MDSRAFEQDECYYMTLYIYKIVLQHQEEEETKNLTVI